MQYHGCLLDNVKVRAFLFLLIHDADPQSRPVVIIVFAHVFRSYVRPSVRPSVCPHFSKQNKFQTEAMFATGCGYGRVDH